MTRGQYKIIAYPDGARKEVGTVHDSSIAEAVADRQAKDRQEFIDIERDGRCVQVVAPPGMGWDRDDS